MLHTHVAHTNTRDDYVTILVFDLEDDNTAGILSIHPYVEETDEIPCENVEKPHIPYKSDENTRISMCKSHAFSCSFWYTTLSIFPHNIYVQLITCNLQ